MSDVRDKLRSAILEGDNSKPATKTITLFGNDVEIRQPSIGTVIDDADKVKNIADILMQYCYVPGTDEKLFDDADRDSLLAMPWGPEFLKAQQAINELAGVAAADVEAAKND